MIIDIEVSGLPHEGKTALVLLIEQALILAGVPASSIHTRDSDVSDEVRERYMRWLAEGKPMLRDKTFIIRSTPKSHR